MKLPPQIVRILLLTVAIVGSFLIAQHFLTPSSFGQYGFYRGDALLELASREPVYAGKSSCVEICHAEVAKKLSAHEHRSLSCEVCHGPGQAHANNPDVKLAVVNYGQCVRCHEANPSRPKWHKQIVSQEHSAGSKCTECHVPHMPREVP